MKKSEKYALLHVGAVVDKTAISALSLAIGKILESASGDEVKKAAIAALSASFSANGASISNCHFSG